jgi:hypothetical protein
MATEPPQPQSRANRLEVDRELAGQSHDTKRQSQSDLVAVYIRSIARTQSSSSTATSGSRFPTPLIRFQVDQADAAWVCSDVG